MEIFITVIVLLILAETTFLTVRHKIKPSSNPKRKVYIDTSTLIDGRILEVAKTGFIGDDLIIPRSVIRELQLLADGKDNEKRTRARHGLDVVNELERVVYCNTTIFPDALDHTPVDERLIELAHENHGVIMTNDYNLNKVATAEKIDVLNINDLALVLRNDYLPGEQFKVKITDVGSGPKQGVGHLPDGTMVVVENAKSKLNKTVSVEFHRFHQTSAGKMMFAKLSTNSRTKKPRSR